MNKKLLLFVLSFVLSLPTFAESMCVNLLDGKTVRFSLENIKDITICDDIVVIDESETPLKFDILSDNTVEVKQDSSYLSLKSIVIPPYVKIDDQVYEVVGIGKSAFDNCTNLKNVKIPSTVTTIEMRAFRNCGMEKLNIPSSIMYIGEYAFSECYMDVVIDNSNGIVYVEQLAFQDHNRVTYTHPEYLVDRRLKFTLETDSTVSVNLLHTANYPFNPIMDTVIIPASVRINGNIYKVDKIEPGTFSMGRNMKHVEIPSTIKTIGANAFYMCSMLTDIKIPSGVTSIGAGAFSSCQKLTNLEIPENITVIESETFYNCSGLTSFNIPNQVTSIGEKAFEKCTGLTSIFIPESVTDIANRAFAYNNGLEVLIDNHKKNVTVGFNAFRGLDNRYRDYYCYVTFIKDAMAEDTTVIQAGFTIYGYKTLTDSTAEISYDKDYKFFSNYRNLDTAYFPEKVRIDRVTHTIVGVGDEAFNGFYNIKHVVFPETFTSIGERSFRGCNGLREIYIPSNITYIGSQAFEGCDSLDIVIDNSEDEVQVGLDAFKGCKSVIWKKKSIVDASTLKIKFKVLTDSTVAVDKLNDKLKINYDDLDTVIIPSKVRINGKKYTVTEIADYAFFHCNTMTYVEIPNTVTSIGERAFEYCDSLTSIVLPESVTNIAKTAFSNCSNLKSINIPSGVTNIGEYTFFQCKSLTTINIPSSVTEIVHGAFHSCIGLTEIVIPSSVVKIDNFVFFGCENLNVEIDNLEENVEFGEKTFYNCKSVKWRK